MTQPWEQEDDFQLWVGQLVSAQCEIVKAYQSRTVTKPVAKAQVDTRQPPGDKRMKGDTE